MSQQPAASQIGPFVPVQIVVALARGELTFRDALGVTDESIKNAARYGHKLLEAEHYSHARTVFDGLAALDPNVAYFHLGLGIALRNLGQREAARAELQKAKELAPADHAADLNLAQMALEDGDRGGARRLLDQARPVVSAPGHPLSEAFRQIWALHSRPA